MNRLHIKLVRRKKRAFILKRAPIFQELYHSLLIDRATAKVTFVASTEGGMDIERRLQKLYKKNLHRPMRRVSDAPRLTIGKGIKPNGSLIKQGENPGKLL